LIVVTLSEYRNWLRASWPSRDTPTVFSLKSRGTALPGGCAP